MTAAYRCVVGVVERLLDMGVPVDILYYSTNAQQSITALQYVCMLHPCGDTRAVEVLLRRGADVNTRRGGRFLPLWSCVRSDNVAFARLLVGFGAERDVMWEGESMVTVAKRRGNLEMVELLEK